MFTFQCQPHEPRLLLCFSMLKPCFLLLLQWSLSTTSRWGNGWVTPVRANRTTKGRSQMQLRQLAFSSEAIFNSLHFSPPLPLPQNQKYKIKIREERVWKKHEDEGGWINKEVYWSFYFKGGVAVCLCWQLKVMYKRKKKDITTSWHRR